MASAKKSASKKAASKPIKRTPDGVVIGWSEKYVNMFKNGYTDKQIAKATGKALTAVSKKRSNLRIAGILPPATNTFPAKKEPVAKQHKQSRSSKKEDIDFHLVDGMPTLPARSHYSVEFLNRVRNTIRDCKPNKKHFLIPKNYKNLFLKIARTEFPEVKMRTALNPDKKTVSMWRVQ